MSSISSVKLHLWWRILVILEFLVVQAFGLNTDGVLLLSFKLFIFSDPLNVLQSWKSSDQTPCSWNGVTCGAPGNNSNGYPRVTGLSLPNCQLLGSIPSDLGMIQYLENLDLSNNSLNGSLPVSIFNATQLRVLDLSNNSITGAIPETIGRLQSLQFLNLSDNALAGALPATLTTIQNLTAVSLKNNYFSGNLPTGFQSVQVLDLSSNLIDGSLPPKFGGNNLRYLNVSYNRLSGVIPPQFAEQITGNATVDLSFNNLTGEIPDSVVFMNQESKSFAGNPDLCGKVTRRDCPIPSSPTSPPAIAAIPKTMDSDTPESSPGAKKPGQNRLKPGTIVGIIVGDIAGIGFVIMVFILVYKLKRKKRIETTTKQEANTAKDNWSVTSSFRTKATKGKGAWYWAHLEPILVRNPDSSLPKAVKLKCSLCDALFSASNPSRTASEHLKRGTCPNFSSVLRPDSSLSPLPISSFASPSVSYHHNHRKRSPPTAIYPLQNQVSNNSNDNNNNNSLAIVESTCFPGYSSHSNNNNAGLSQHHLVLSGGKEDLGALAMLEDSVKKLKSPKISPGPALSKGQIDSAFDLLADWFYESCGSVSFSSLEHPKFRAFLNQVGMPALSKRDLSGARLDSKFHEAKRESEARIRDAVFFQVASDGWKRKSCCCSSFTSSIGSSACVEENFVKFSVNLPNGSSLYQKAVFTGGPVTSKHAEEVLWETVTGISGSAVQKCVGVVSDNAKAFRNLEIQNHWMVNLSCQLEGFVSLIKDFSKELLFFRTVTENSLKLVNFVNNKWQVRNSFQKYRMQELECAGLIRVPFNKCHCSSNIAHVFAMLEDILNCSQVLQMVVLDDSYKVICIEDPVAREVAGIVQNEGFWNDLGAVYALMKLIRGMAHEIEVERPLIGQCLPLWEELRVKVKEWCTKFKVAEAPVEKIVEKRFRKNYHPAWSAAFILDPLYLIRDTNGKYLPPFKCLTHEQEKDVDRLITRLVTKEEAHVALMELMKWRSEGLEPLYAQAVQVKQRDFVTGKMKIANPQSSRLVWETCLSEYKSLGKVAVRLIFLHATSCGFKHNWSLMKWICVHRHSRIGLERAQKMIFVAAHSKLGRRDFSNEEEKDAELFMIGNEDDILNEVFADAP